MQVTSSASSIFSGYAARSTAASAAHAAVTASNSTDPAPSGSDGVKTVDFTHMTRQELFDWMNSEIRSGKMSFEESSPFLGMTLQVSAETGQPVDMRTDTTVYDFTAIARRGIDGARSRNDEAAAKRLEEALALMQRQQGSVAMVNVKV
ncbi:hypothetical protein RA307_24730 [Xanthobacteraceae bacterium Astr-EGSB]|uniref:hypothetical protein n=1 Tax=Astrobacterium formosum TaxID=3069710 RepID=UPI0027B45353|nr:hypothetical protein [Xanthobacteraceae bacterium Astr-EGSB]